MFRKLSFALGVALGISAPAVCTAELDAETVFNENHCCRYREAAAGSRCVMSTTGIAVELPVRNTFECEDLCGKLGDELCAPTISPSLGDLFHGRSVAEKDRETYALYNELCPEVKRRGVKFLDRVVAPSIERAVDDERRRGTDGADVVIRLLQVRDRLAQLSAGTIACPRPFPGARGTSGEKPEAFAAVTAGERDQRSNTLSMGRIFASFQRP